MLNSVPMHTCGKVALISGAASGIGLAITTELLKNGAMGVVIIDINKEAGESVTSNLANQFGKDRVTFCKTDVTSDVEFEAAFAQAMHIFGKLDIVVNCAGIMNDVNFSLCIATNLTAVIRGTELGLKYMGKNEGGRGGIIINVASIAALQFHFSPVYSAAKAGSVNFVRGIGHPFFYNKTGVKVMALCPGGTMTTMLSQVTFRDGCFTECARDYIGKSAFQMPHSVALSAMHIIENANSGTVWVSEANDLFILNEPNLEDYRKIVIHNISNISNYNYYCIALLKCVFIGFNILFKNINYVIKYTFINKFK